MSNIINSSDATFANDVLQSDVPVLVDFWATWCGPCRAIAPVLESLSEDYAGKAKIVKVDVDANPQTAAQFGVRSIPSLFVVKNGAVVDSTVGAQPKNALASLLDKHL